MEPHRQEQLGNILSALVEHHGWRRAEWISVLKVLWKDVAGEILYDHSWIITLTSDHILIVAVPSSVWAQQLALLKSMILDHIRLRHPEIVIRDIRTRVRAEGNRDEKTPAESKRSPYYSGVSRPLTDRDLHVLLASVKEKYERASQDWFMRGFSPCRRCLAPTLDGYHLCVVCELARKEDKS